MYKKHLFKAVTKFPRSRRRRRHKKKTQGAGLCFLFFKGRKVITAGSSWKNVCHSQWKIPGLKAKEEKTTMNICAIKCPQKASFGCWVSPPMAGCWVSTIFEDSLRDSILERIRVDSEAEPARFGDNV